MNLRIIFAASILILMIAPNCRAQRVYTVCLFDSARERRVPVTIYQPEKIVEPAPVIIFSHGYGVNAPGSNQTYSSLTGPLSDRGYFVISIQHELPDDPLLAMEGDFMQTRMAAWQRGVENILFTIREFKKLKPEFDWRKMTVMGHSNGGDISMLYATRYPETVCKVISLDHRRMIMPRTDAPRVYTLRGCDYPADDGVLPSGEEQKKYQMTVTGLEDIKHSQMDDKGSREQHEKMLGYLYRFLDE